MEPDKNYSALQASSATASAVACLSHLLDVALPGGPCSLCHVRVKTYMPRRVCPCSGMSPLNAAEQAKQFSPCSCARQLLSQLTAAAGQPIKQMLQNWRAIA